MSRTVQGNEPMIKWRATPEESAGRYKTRFRLKKGVGRMKSLMKMGKLRTSHPHFKSEVLKKEGGSPLGRPD